MTLLRKKCPGAAFLWHKLKMFRYNLMLNTLRRPFFKNSWNCQFYPSRKIWSFFRDFFDLAITIAKCSFKMNFDTFFQIPKFYFVGVKSEIYLCSQWIVHLSNSPGEMCLVQKIKLWFGNPYFSNFVHNVGLITSLYWLCAHFTAIVQIVYR